MLMRSSQTCQKEPILVVKNRTAVFMVCTEGQAEYSTKVFMISTLCNDASHPIPHPKCQSGALVCVSCWEQQVAVNRYIDTPVRETDRQNRWLLLSPHDCERAQSRRQDPPLFLEKGEEEWVVSLEKHKRLRDTEKTFDCYLHSS